MIRNKIYIALAGLLTLVSCGSHEQKETEHEYSSLEICPQKTVLNEYYSASIRGRRDIALFPQVGGTISHLYVTEGQKVRKGDILFIIDQVPYKAALKTAQANVEAARAQVETAVLDYDSKKILFEEEVISEYDLSLAKNALAVAKANLAQALAYETEAANSLSYTEIKSPLDGVAGTIPYREGALVGPDIPQPLTTVSDNAVMYVYFSMTEKQIRKYLRIYGTPDKMIEGMPPVQLQLNDGTIYPVKGKIESISGIVDEQTGTVLIRCVFPNEDRTLFSGSIGDIILTDSVENAIIIPQEATYELQDRIYVYTVKDGKAVSTHVTVNRLNDGNEYIVTSGLNEGDIIVTEGVGLINNGMEIKIEGR